MTRSRLEVVPIRFGLWAAAMWCLAAEVTTRSLLALVVTSCLALAAVTWCGDRPAVTESLVDRGTMFWSGVGAATS